MGYQPALSIRVSWEGIKGHSSGAAGFLCPVPADLFTAHETGAGCINSGIALGEPACYPARSLIPASHQRNASAPAVFVTGALPFAMSSVARPGKGARQRGCGAVHRLFPRKPHELDMAVHIEHIAAAGHMIEVLRVRGE